MEVLKEYKEKSLKSWMKELDFFKSNDWKGIQDFIYEKRKEGRPILPGNSNVFNALKLTPLDNVKVVILGQDPYPNRNHAHGLSFSVPRECKAIPRSLQNIFKEYKNDLGYEIPDNGNLEAWALNGVLLLNTVLTVQEKLSNSHKDLGWEKLTTEILKKIDEKTENTVFILWGNQAQKYEYLIDKTKHLVIKSAHPSPLSANRGFFGSKPFSTACRYREAKGKESIVWNLNENPLPF